MYGQQDSNSASPTYSDAWLILRVVLSERNLNQESKNNFHWASFPVAAFGIQSLQTFTTCSTHLLYVLSDEENVHDAKSKLRDTEEDVDQGPATQKFDVSLIFCDHLSRNFQQSTQSQDDSAQEHSQRYHTAHTHTAKVVSLLKGCGPVLNAYSTTCP